MVCNLQGVNRCCAHRHITQTRTMKEGVFARVISAKRSFLTPKQKRKQRRKQMHITWNSSAVTLGGTRKRVLDKYPNLVTAVKEIIRAHHVVAAHYRRHDVVERIGIIKEAIVRQLEGMDTLKIYKALS